MDIEMVDDNILYRHFAEERANRREEGLLIGMLCTAIVAVALIVIFGGAL